MTGLTRRAALGTALIGAGAACARTAARTTHDAVTAAADAMFAHGVASGDPASDSVVLWTRVTTQNAEPVAVFWEVSEDAGFSTVAAAGETAARPEADFTVKALAEGLKSGGAFHYRFRVGEKYSPIGRTRTLPEGALDAARFAVVSCANYAYGFFNVYDLIARERDFDAVIHLGDYLYEYGAAPGQYGAETAERLGRTHAPQHEMVTLADYRLRHAQYKSDPSSQAAHAAHPFIVIWDDHETANDSWKDGAQNHDPATEGDWAARKRAAMQAYYEWMPVREPAPGRPKEALFRAYSFGDLLTIAALETRLMARSRQVAYNEIVPTLTSPDAVAKFRDVDLWSADREMMGADQLAYIAAALKESAARGEPWRIIANQVIMARVTAPNIEPHLDEASLAELEAQWDQARAFVKFSTLGLPTNLDAWDGYPAARERFYDAVKAARADGLVVVTGDTHTWWANNLTDRGGKHLGVELGVHSITSPSPYRKEFLGGKGAEYALLTGQVNKDVRYISGEDHGYIALKVTRDRIDAQFIAVDSVEVPRYAAFEKAAFTIRKSAGAAQIAAVRGLSVRERAVF